MYVTTKLRPNIVTDRCDDLNVICEKGGCDILHCEAAGTEAISQKRRVSKLPQGHGNLDGLRRLKGGSTSQKGQQCNYPQRIDRQIRPPASRVGLVGVMY